MTVAGKVIYREYIQSDEWKARRTAALKRAIRPRQIGPSCEVCGRHGTSYKNSRSSLDYRDRQFRVDGANGLNVHHLTYRSLGAEEPRDLIVLCTDVAVWSASGYRDTSSGKGCHERAHSDPAFRTHVEQVARQRRLP